MTVRRSLQTAVFVAGMLVVVFVQRVAQLDLWGQIPVLAPAVAVLGLPHGALDLPMVEAEWPLRRLRDRMLFFASYLGLAAIWVGAAMLPPLLYFVAYFCLLHSLRHLTTTLALLPDRTRALAGAARIMAASLLGAGAALALAIGGAGADAGNAILGVVFIGLAALTVPHMLLVDRFAEASAGSDR